MEKLNFGLRSFAKQSTPEAISSSSGSTQQPQLLVRVNPGRAVSLWTASKLCAISFVVGIVVGFTLKRRLRRWASRLLKRLKYD